jgi:hypothetical protein
MHSALVQGVAPGELRLAGLTPVDRVAYSMEYLHRYKLPQESAVEKALTRGGGRLRNFVEQGDTWLVHWLDSAGDLHSSSIRKDDLGVVSAGICLSGEDDKFDLTSLVGVVEGFP